MSAVLLSQSQLEQISNRWRLLPSGNQRSNRKTLEYLQEMAARTGGDLSKVDILTVFAQDMLPAQDGYSQLVADKNELNKRYFEACNESIESTRKLTEFEVERLHAVVDRDLTQLARQWGASNNSLGDLDAAAARNFRAWADSEAKARAARYQQYSAKEAKEFLDRIALGFREALARGFWCDLKIDRSIIYLRTRNPVVCLDRNNAAGIDLSKNMGWMSVILNPLETTRNVNVVPIGRNQWHSAQHYSGQIFWHPFISNNGQVCFGNGKNLAVSYMRDGRVGDLLELLETVLTTYTGNEMPYVKLEAFQACPRDDYYGHSVTVPIYTPHSDSFRPPAIQDLVMSAPAPIAAPPVVVAVEEEMEVVFVPPPAEDDLENDIDRLSLSMEGLERIEDESDDEDSDESESDDEDEDYISDQLLASADFGTSIGDARPLVFQDYIGMVTTPSVPTGMPGMEPQSTTTGWHVQDEPVVMTAEERARVSQYTDPGVTHSETLQGASLTEDFSPAEELARTIDANILEDLLRDANLTEGGLHGTQPQAESEQTQPAEQGTSSLPDGDDRY